MNPTLEFVARLERAKADAERKRRLGRWPPWERRPIPPETNIGWGFTHVANNGLFCVLTRTLEDGAIHAMISSLPGQAEPSWSEKQKIKDTLFGARWAVECFPPRARLVDAAESYHLWVLPEGAPWPYDLRGDR